MIKRSLLFVYLALCSLCSWAEVASGETDNGLKWSISDDLTLTITGSGPMDICSAIESAFEPKVIGEYTKVVIGEGITSVAAGAFANNEDITSVQLPSTITTIGEFAFEDCESLKSINIPAGVVYVGNGAFDGCESLPVTSGVRYAGTVLVEAVDMEKKSYTVKSGTRFIAYAAFSGCSKMEEISIPASVVSIGDGAFHECESLPVEDGVRYAGPVLVEAVDKTLGAYTIKPGTRFIMDYAFADCKKLQLKSLPESVVGVGTAVFYGCQLLDTPLYNSTVFAQMPVNYAGSYTIPAGIRHIAGGAFAECQSLTSVSVPSSVQTIGMSAFLGCEKLTTVNLPASGLLSIREYAFSESGLTEFIFPSTLLEFDGNTVFADCDDLTTLTYAPGTKVARYAGLDRIKTVNIPEGVTAIGAAAFFFCANLTKVSLPKSITRIGSYAFAGCEELTELKLPDGVSYIGLGAFMMSGLKEPIYTSNTFYFLPTDYAGAYTIPSGIQKIAFGAFGMCENLTSVTIPNSVTELESNAFTGSGVRSISLPSSITSIPIYAFEECTKLKSVVIPNSVTEIGEGAFARCEKLTEVTLPSSLTELADYTFTECKSLATITLPSSLVKIGYSAFRECEALKEIVIPHKVKSIEGIAFMACKSLKKVVCTATSVPKLGFDMFLGIADGSVLQVPESKIEAYKASDWSKYFSTIEAMESVKIETMTFAQTNVDAMVGVKLNLTDLLVVTPVNASDLRMTWTLSDDSMGVIDEDGIMTPLKEGTVSVLAQTKDGSNKMAFCNVNIKAAELELDDDMDSFGSDYDIAAKRISYTQEFDGMWESIYLPYSLDCAALKGSFDIAELTNANYLESTYGDYAVLEATLKESGMTEPNTPYLIRARQKGVQTITVVNTTLKATEEKELQCSSADYAFLFVPAYSFKEFDEAYTMTGGWLSYSTPAAIGPFHWALTITPRTAMPDGEAREMKLPQSVEIIISEDAGTDAIDEVAAQPQTEGQAVYNLQGQRLGRLQKGLNIVDGRKMIVK